MIIPKKLKIGGHNIIVNCSQELTEMSSEWDNFSNTIRIDKRLSQTQKEVALLHEIIHICNSVFGDKDIFHALMDSLSEQFYQVLKDNNLLK